MTLRLLLDEIRSNIQQICSKLNYPEVKFEVSEASKAKFGDVSCNVAFLLAKSLKKKPFDIGKIISEEYQKNPGKFVKQSASHPSGYMNFFANYETLNNATISASVEKNY
ncbi:MAG: arginine--tRNA ligase, partial [Nitrosopumilaceae archaeon]